MAEAAAAAATGMSAVIGGDEAAVVARLHELDLTPANYNGGGQLVAAGALDALQALSAEPIAGTRVIPLQVAGAFHTRYMAPAVETLRAARLADARTTPQSACGRTGTARRSTSGAAFRDLLVDQVASPVRWDLCMASFAEAGVTGLVELSPAGTLIGLAKRALRGVPAVAVKTPNDIEAAAALLNGASA